MVRQRVQEAPIGNSSAETELDYLMKHDPLTGLLNRAGFLSALQTLLDESPVEEPEIGILFLNVDHFRAINDDLGIMVGDEVLTGVAERLRSSTRRSAIVARLSGDEFVVVDDFGDASETCSTAERLLSALSEPMIAGGMSIETSVSIGAALAHRDDTPDRLLGRATAAGRKAKRRGRNRYEVQNRSDDDRGSGKITKLRDLRHAIENNGLSLHYQPQIGLSCGEMVGFEALVRWDHPDRGLLGPVEFIDLAESSGLILPLGAWLIGEAVAQQAQWHRSAPGRSPVRMSINISAIQLNDPGLVGTVTDALERYDMTPALLTLEITETAITEDPVAALQTLQVLNTLGVRLAVDDFGTGHSSLTYLKRFPIDEVKIDRSFIAGLTSHKKDRAIVASCIQLAHAMDMVAVAEGVETDDQRKALTELGCDLAQGYHYTKPMSASDLMPWFTARPETVNVDPASIGQ